MRTIPLSILSILLGTQLALADNGDVTPTQDDHASHKLIKPTSSGSSGNGAMPETSGGGEEGSLSGTELSKTKPQTGSANGQINPYPNAANNAGQLVGGSVTGTGAMSSAYPGH